MTSRTIVQPGIPLGAEIGALLEVEANYQRITFVSAFVALRTILRLRDRLIHQIQTGCRLRLTVGIDLGGTSREVLEELLRWTCEVFVFHNALPRATFHPKIYLFESAVRATLIVGSNNLTDGGFYTNYEAAVRHDFEMPADGEEFRRITDPLLPFLEPAGATVQRLSAGLIDTLSARGSVPTESEARENRRNQAEQRRRPADAPANLFQAVAVPNPPLLPRVLRALEPMIAQNEAAIPPAGPVLRARSPGGLLVWQKWLTPTDALKVNKGSHHVGGVRLTQAAFESSPGHGIDQTTYFRNLFRDFRWEAEGRRHLDQEHTFIPMRVIIRERDYGIRNFEISHKPAGEAGQANYTTILRWGGEFTQTIAEENVTGLLLSIYETPDADAPFSIEIT